VPVASWSASDDAQLYYGNFEEEFRNFWNNSNYYCIFAGLGFEPDQPYPALTYRPDRVTSAAPVFEQIKHTQDKLTETLPTTYEYLCQLHGR
jgi:tryptophan halogenase